ncbi:MAG: DUF4058 family protein [Planctomycetaceae bacterium]
MKSKKSPFPGMDPYLESKWREVHARLIVYAANEINQHLPDDLQANIEESLAVYAEGEHARSIIPDIHVAEEPSFRTGTPVESHAGSSQATVAAPILLKRPPHATRHLEITTADGKVVTAIEFLSPWNKVGSRNREQYTRKQLGYLDAGVNLVEIDLVRQGAYVLAAPLEEILEDQRTPYMVCVSRGIDPFQVELYRAPLQERLPNIPIPLRPDERDLVLELQPLIDACYRDGRYYRFDYSVPPAARFNESDSAWIAAILKERDRSI